MMPEAFSKSNRMRVTFDYLPEFERGAKALRKKYPSFESDYDTFLDELEKNPYLGEPLGHPLLIIACGDVVMDPLRGDIVHN